MPYYFGDVISPHPFAEWQPMVRYDTGSYVILINQCNQTIPLPEEEGKKSQIFCKGTEFVFPKAYVPLRLSINHKRRHNLKCSWLAHCWTD